MGNKTISRAFGDLVGLMAYRYIVSLFIVLLYFFRRTKNDISFFLNQ